MFDITYKGITGRSLGVYVAKRPAVPSPKEDIDTYIIGGRDGILTGSGRYQQLEISVELGFRVDNPNTFGTRYREIKQWLTGSDVLSLSDDIGVFYKVYYVELSSPKRTVRHQGGITAKFVCDPYTYLTSGKNSVSLIKGTQTITNPGIIAHPVFRFKSNDEQDITITVNGKTAYIYGTGDISVDTDRMITYSSIGSTIRNTDFTGDYSNLWLANGSNTVKISATILTTEILMWPNWRMI